MGFKAESAVHFTVANMTDTAGETPGEPPADAETPLWRLRQRPGAQAIAAAMAAQNQAGGGPRGALHDPDQLPGDQETPETPAPSPLAQGPAEPKAAAAAAAAAEVRAARKNDLAPALAYLWAGGQAPQSPTVTGSPLPVAALQPPPPPAAYAPRPRAVPAAEGTFTSPAAVYASVAVNGSEVVAMLLPGEAQSGEVAERKLSSVMLTSAQPTRLPRRQPPPPPAAAPDSKAHSKQSSRRRVGLLRRLVEWLYSLAARRKGPEGGKELPGFKSVTHHGLNHDKHPRLLQEFLELPPGELPVLAASAHPGLFYLHPDSSMTIEVGIKDASRLPVPKNLLGCPYRKHPSQMCIAPSGCNCHKGRCTEMCTLGDNIVY